MGVGNGELRMGVGNGELRMGVGNGELRMGAGNEISADTMNLLLWLPLLTLSLLRWRPSHKSISLSPPQPPRHHPSPQSGRSAVTGYRGHHDSCVRSCDSHVTVNMNLIYLNWLLKWECMHNCNTLGYAYKLQFSIWTNSHSHPMLPGYIWQLVARQQLLIIHSQKQKMALWRLEVEKDGFTRHINHEARMKISLRAHTRSLA